jgi:hypothetical protein
MYLNEMGIFQSEFGFPTTKHETYYLRANLELAAMGVLKPIRLEGWLRCVFRSNRPRVRSESGRLFGENGHPLGGTGLMVV